jgi:hypothetical protein
VIGTTFMVLVIMFLSTSVFLWTLSQNTLYNEALRARNQEEADRRSENVVAVSGNYSVNEVTDEVTVNVVLKNAGSVSVQIINLWVLDSDPSNQRYTNKSLNLNLKSGDVLNLVGSSGLKVTILGAKANHTFTSWFVTAKGNTIPLEKELGIIVAQVSQGIGSVGMDFGTFVYYHVDYVSGKYRLRQTEWPNGLGGFTVPSRTNIAFRVTLTNFDTNRRTIQLNSHSVLWMIFTASEQQPRSTWWYIVKVDVNGIFTTFTPVTLSYGVPEQVFFASSADGSFSPSDIGTPISPNQPAAVNLMLLGTIGTSNFGQNIPFVSIYVT